MSSCHSEPARPSSATAVLGAPTLSIALVGNPNVGKSTLFNALTGNRQKVSNVPGTTVELRSGRWPKLGARGSVNLLDLPGTYSLLARSPDEMVTANALRCDTAGSPEAIIVMLDESSLTRSLYLLAQVAQLNAAAPIPLIAALTLRDVAQSRGLTVCPQRLSDALGIAVVPINPRTGAGSADLHRVVGQVLDDAANGHIATVRDIGPVSSSLTDLLEHDLARIEPLFTWVDEVHGRVTAGTEADAEPDAALDGSPDAGTDSLPGKAPVKVPGAASRATMSDRVDRLLLHPLTGLPVFLAVMWATFQLATSVATPLMDGVDGLVNGPIAAVARAILPGPAWLEGFLVDGVLAGVGTVATFAPLMGLMFLALAVLEDSGYLARAAFMADRAMRAIGLDGRAMLPLVVGFGCNLPAISATRALPHARQRLLTALLVPYTSCAARLTVYILLAGTFFPENAGTVIFLMYVLSIVLVVAAGWVMRRTLFRDLVREPFVIVLPAYQRPRLRSLVTSAWTRVRAFVISAGKIIVLTLAVVWVLQAVPVTGDHQIADVPVADSAYGQLAQGIAPVLAPAGFGDWHASAALVTGFVAKEVVVGAFAQSYAVDEPLDPAQGGTLGERLRATFEESSGGHAGAAALAFMVFVLAYTPCLATVAEQARVIGTRWTVGAVGIQLLVAWLLAVVVFQVGRLLG